MIDGLIAGRLIGDPEQRVGGKDHFGSGSRQPAPIFRLPRLHDHRKPFGRAGYGQRPFDLEMRALMVGVMHLARVKELPVSWSRTKASSSKLSHSFLTTSTSSAAR